MWKNSNDGNKSFKQQVHFTKAQRLTNFTAIICTDKKKKKNVLSQPGSNSCPNFLSSNTIFIFSNK